MPGVSRVGRDSAKGIILGTGASKVFTEGSRTSLLGDKVAPHGIPPHTSPTIAKSSTTVFAQGKGVVRKGDPATCGHATTGSSTVFSG